MFLYPSSIAAYGLPALEAKRQAGRVREDEWTHPTTMYGCNKLYCEQLGSYYARHYKQLAAESQAGRVDFRAVRFPGLISARDRAVGRHVGLRARDDSRGRAGRAVRAASSGRTRGFRSWRCPTAWTRCSRWRRRRAIASDADRLQPRALRADGRRGARGSPARVSRRRTSPTSVDREAPGHRRLLAGGRRRLGRAPRLGIRAEVRLRRARSGST